MRRREAVGKIKTNTGRNACATVAQAFLPVWILNRILHGFRVMIFVLAMTSLQAATTATWEMNSYQDFLKGRFTGVSLEHDGRLSIAPRLETVFSSGQPVLWSLAQAPHGSLYPGPGHRGHVD